MKRVALVAVDLQGEFFDPRVQHVGKPRKAVCLPQIRKLLPLARKAGWSVIHAKTVHLGPHTLPTYLQQTGQKPFCLDGSPGAEIIRGLVEEGDVVVTKSHYSAFSSPELKRHLEQIEKVVLVGVAADCCILHTAFDAATRYGKVVYLPYQAVAAANLKAYSRGFHILGKSAARIVDAERLFEGDAPDWAIGMEDQEEAARVATAWFEPRARKVEELEDLLDAGSDFSFEELLRRIEDEVTKV
jgi:nicotinamidase-related amidase